MSTWLFHKKFDFLFCFDLLALLSWEYCKYSCTAAKKKWHFGFVEAKMSNLWLTFGTHLWDFWFTFLTQDQDSNLGLGFSWVSCIPFHIFFCLLDCCGFYTKNNVAFTLISFGVLKWDDRLSVQLPFVVPVQILVHF